MDVENQLSCHCFKLSYCEYNKLLQNAEIQERVTQAFKQGSTRYKAHYSCILKNWNIFKNSKRLEHETLIIFSSV